MRQLDRREELYVDASRVRMAPDGRVAVRTEHRNPNDKDRRWVCASVPYGIVHIELLTDAEVAAWAPMLPVIYVDDDAFEPDAEVIGGG